jgi:hypothetical protein
MNEFPNWYEVWADTTTDPPYVLVVRNNDKEFVVTDPKTDDRAVFVSPVYNDVRLWLLEDEYIRVDGRMNFDE